MRKKRTIRGFILTAAFVVSVVVFSGLYLATLRIYEEAVETNAIAVSETLAEGTFNAMFQIMRQGWTRPQLEEFIGSLEKASEQAGHSVSIYRGDLVTELFGPIAQGEMDGPIRNTFARTQPRAEMDQGGVRYLYPLAARGECLQCHVNAKSGDVLGVIEVRQDITHLVERTRSDLLAPLLLLAPLPLLMAMLVAYLLNVQIQRSIRHLEENIDGINKVSDLTHLELKPMDLGFAELNAIFDKVEALSDKLRGVAVDKELLEFEIRLLEKFVITSEVVRDWREYICYLLRDINQVIEAYTLFSIFKIDEELFDLEVFWIRPPSKCTRDTLEQAIRTRLAEHSSFAGVGAIQINHNVVDPTAELIEYDGAEFEVQTKSLIVDTPKIGGIVGIGVHTDIVRDETRLLVMESILSTLLNVVGSVKAIYKYTKDLEYYATRDPLTNLYNQRIFWELLGYEIQRAERHEYSFALLVIDMDNFKTINDTFGHAFGDRFLQQFASAVHTALRTGDILARYGGDEFVVILPESDTQQAQGVAERVLENASRLVLEAPDGTQVKATVSIGVAMFPDHATETKDLFLFADNMMYKAKSEGKNRIGIPSEDEVVELFRSIGEKSMIIANAIEERRIIPHFQPILDVASGEVAAVEVLSRIGMQGGTILGAHEFIEIAEKMGLIHKIDYIVMDKAFETVRRSDYKGLIFLNLSPRALVLSEFIRNARHLTAEHGIAPQRVVFEITERDTVKNISLLEKFVAELKMEGFKLAIDDFGSGFSSFHYLKRFPIDIVKIEGDFVLNMAEDPRDAAFVRSIANLAQELGIETVAEYVESADVLSYVSHAGITYAQGYHIAPPAPDLAEVLERVRKAGAQLARAPNG